MVPFDWAQFMSEDVDVTIPEECRQIAAPGSLRFITCGAIAAEASRIGCTDSGEYRLTKPTADDAHFGSLPERHHRRQPDFAITCW